MTPHLTINRNIHPPGRSHGLPPFATAIFAGWVFLCLPAATPLHAEIGLPAPPKGEKRRKEPLPPVAVPVTIRIAPRATVKIPLRIYARQGGDLNYLIRKEPQFGKIVRIEPVDLDTWVLTYQQTAAMEGDGDLHDRIVYAAQNRNGTSAPVEIDIQIVDIPPLPAAPERLDFGEVLLGDTVARTITIANHGGGIMEGDFAVDAPWRIEPSHYRLRRGEEARFRVTLTAPAEQEFRGSIRFPGFPQRETVLHATGAAPVSIAPHTVDLLASEPGRARTGTLTLTNRTGQERTVRLAADARLHLPSELKIPAYGATPITPTLEPGDTAAIDSLIAIQDGENILNARVQAVAATLPLPQLQWEPGRLNFGPVEIGQSHTRTVRLRNTGKVAAQCNTELPAPFKIDAESFTLEPGAETTLQITVAPAWPGNLSAALTVHTSGTHLSVPLAAQVLSHVTVTGSGPSASNVVAATLSQPGQAGEESHARLLSGIAAIRGIDLDRTTPGTAVLSWKPPLGPASHPSLDYRVEVRRLLTDASGTLKVVWIPLPTVRYEKTPERVTAHLSQIPPGIGVTARIVSITPEGRESEPSSPIQFFVPAKPIIFTWQRLLLTLFAGMGGVALWLQRRSPMR
jgi:hypothetical protein